MAQVIFLIVKTFNEIKLSYSFDEKKNDATIKKLTASFNQYVNSKTFSTKRRNIIFVRRLVIIKHNTDART